MNEVEQILIDWKNELCQKVDLAALHSRSPGAHKWKAPYRSLVLRESVFWRLQDLLSQAYALHQAGHTLGSRILLRSAFETLATLIYLNQLTRNVLNGTEDFHSFSLKTSRLLLGSRDKSTKHEAINIITVLEKCDKKYPGLMDLYVALSESAHPNFEGICFGYSRIDYDKDTTVFSNNMAEMYAAKQISSMQLCMMIFQAEYNDEWPSQFERLEAWIVENDATLEASKGEGV